MTKLCDYHMSSNQGRKTDLIEKDLLCHWKMSVSITQLFLNPLIYSGIRGANC